jgi:hypothetical protein
MPVMVMRKLVFFLFFLLMMSIAEGVSNASAQSPTATIADVTIEPRSVAPETDFSVLAQVSYNFLSGQYEIRVAVTDPSTLLTVPGGEYKFDQLAKSGNKTYVFSIKARSAEGPWLLRASVEYRNIQTDIPFAHSISDWSRIFTVPIAQPKYALAVKLVPKATLNVLGSTYESDASGVVKISDLTKGTYLVEAQTVVPVGPDTRYVFTRWQDGDTANPKTSNLSQDLYMIAVYEKQFYLSVESSAGTASGSGWYAEGSVAIVSVVPISIQMTGILGLLGGRTVFSGWTGDATSLSPTSPVQMDQPQSVMAQWTDDMGPVYLSIALIVLILAVIAIVIFLAQRRRKPPPTPLITGTGVVGMPMQQSSILTLKVQAPPISYCQSCGLGLPSGGVKCPSCGAPVKR